MRKRGPYCRPVSVYLLYCIQTSEDVNFFLSPVVTILIFYPYGGTRFEGEPLQRGRQIHRRCGNFAISTEIAVNLGNSTR